MVPFLHDLIAEPPSRCIEVSASRIEVNSETTNKLVLRSPTSVGIYYQK